jgi:hypothetical protein
VLATLGASVVAGCGWSQDGERGEPAGDTGGSEDDGAEELAESEGGEGLVEADAEELLLGLDAVGSEWEETAIQRTGTCNAFEWDGDTFTYTLETCARVYDDEATATEEYERGVETSAKLLARRLDLDPAIGDQAAVFRDGRKTNQWSEFHVRVQFRDANATGRVEFTEDAPSGQPGERLGVPEQYPSDVVEWAAAMHEEWRD